MDTALQMLSANLGISVSYKVTDFGAPVAPTDVNKSAA